MRLFSGHDGAAAVELALLLPLLATLAFGIIEFSTAYNRSQGMQAAVREGARLAASATPSEQVELDAVEQAVRASLPDNGAGAGFPAAETDLSDITVAVQNLDEDGDLVAGDGICVGENVDSVRVEAEIAEGDPRQVYGLELIVIGNVPLSLHASAVFPCLNPS